MKNRVLEGKKLVFVGDMYAGGVSYIAINYFDFLKICGDHRRTESIKTEKKVY